MSSHYRARVPVPTETRRKEGGGARLTSGPRWLMLTLSHLEQSRTQKPTRLVVAWTPNRRTGRAPARSHVLVKRNKIHQDKRVDGKLVFWLLVITCCLFRRSKVTGSK